MRHFRFRRGRVVLITAAGLAVAAISASWEGVNGRANADAARTNQIAQNGLLYNCLLQSDVNLTSPPQPADCTDTSTGTAFTPPRSSTASARSTAR